jgi:heptosyltransferase-2
MPRFLVIRGGAIGDFILTLPVFEAIHSKHENAEISILGYSDIAELAVGRRHAQEVWRVDAAEWAPLFAPGGELRDRERQFIRQFQRVYCIWPDRDGTLQANLRRGGAEDVVSIDPMPPEKGDVHAVDHVARQCEKAGLPVKHLDPHLYPSEKDRWWAERFMRVTGAGQAPLMGLGPGSGSSKKNWPASSFCDLARWWIGRRGHILLVGGPADEVPLAEFNACLQNENAIFTFISEPLSRVAAVVERCDVFVGNDSGPTHIAAAVRTPTIALFGPTNPVHWRPKAPHVAVLQGEGGDMAKITPDEVRRQVPAVMKAG